jgi:hypothetical protein
MKGCIRLPFSGTILFTVRTREREFVNSLVILMIEEEQPEGLSARKLVVETAKHNVLTAYNASDGIDLLRRFPNVDIILVHSGQLSRHPEILQEIKADCPGKPIILASPFAQETQPEATYVIDSHRPQDLLLLLARLHLC